MMFNVDFYCYGKGANGLEDIFETVEFPYGTTRDEIKKAFEEWVLQHVSAHFKVKF